ncbi:glycoside hydrolase family 76 protein [Nocardia yamanashiensis]|uniref:glycoside hydrolase family 76 protein n=1 Tax=Nocardia yamanashiensis TaxID=209247 RepID=UPI0012FDEBC9|nr:glycoside hydrolase family 76 protein [Nocardia yamanashiensis]
MIGSKAARWWALVGIVVLATAIHVLSRPEPAHEVAAPVRVWSRVITLTAADGRATAAIDNGGPGDSVWLDRGDGELRVRAGRVGTAAVAEHGTSARTDSHRYGGDRLRACGKAGDRAEIRCTRWTSADDPAPDRVGRALERLLDRYDHRTGLWENDSSTWQSANALTTLLDYATRTGDRQYLGYLEETYSHGAVSDLGVPRDTGYNDDELWWALAWIEGYDLTHEARYLEAARRIVDRMHDRRASFCGGGLAWARTGVDPELRPWEQVNSITNGLYLTATAALAARVDPALRTTYLDRATATWDWFATRSGHPLLDSTGLINDHLDRYDDTCVLVDENRRWTYGQAALISGLVALHRATNNPEPLAAADRIATAATGSGSPFLDDGVLIEPSAVNCPGPGCRDAETYRGVFVRAYRDLLDTGASRVASPEFLTRQANSLRGAADEYGFRWQGAAAADDRPNFATQAAALDALLPLRIRS